MASVNDLLSDAFERVGETVHRVIDRLTDQQLSARIAEDANTIGWLVWHLTRVMDDHVAAAQGDEQVWTGGGWCDRFGLPFDRMATGYGQTPDQVAEVQVAGELLTGYHDAVQAYVHEVVASLSATDLDRIVDRRWDPPVTLAVRLVSVINDATQHAGQAAYAAGVLREG